MKTAKTVSLFLLLASPLVWAEPATISILQEHFYPLSFLNSRLMEVRRHFTGGGDIASWYSRYDPGINRHTASGEVFNDRLMTCASWDYPFGSTLKVQNKANGKWILCRVNDRGPAKRLDRKIDLTKTAFRKIANLKTGLIRVNVTRVDKNGKPAN